MSRYTVEEEEQINKLKDFWASYGNFILTVLILVFGSFAAHNGYQWYQARTAGQAVLAFERIEKAVAERNLDLLAKVQGTLFDEHGGSPYAERGAVLASKAFYEGGQIDQAQASLQWVVDHGDLAEYTSMARLTLSGILVEKKEYDQAFSLLEGQAGEGFEGLFLDRMGDVRAAQGRLNEAKALYEQSATALQPNSPWKNVVERKIAALPAEK